MAKVSGGGFVRIVAAFAVVSLAYFFSSLAPFLHAAPGLAVNGSTPAVSVNRYRKGDRLPVLGNSEDFNRTGAKGPNWDLHGQGSSQVHGQVPIGCDPAFSPVSSPSLATVFGRCTT
jgi:hypothetical protein